jgi:hypothetical protein
MKMHSTLVRQERHANILNLCLQHLARCKDNYAHVEALLGQRRIPEAVASVDSLLRLIQTCPPPLDGSNVVADLKVRVLIHLLQRCARPYTDPCSRFERQRARTTRAGVLPVHQYHQQSLLHPLTILRTPCIGFYLFLDARGRTIYQVDFSSKRHSSPHLGSTNIGKRFRLYRVTFNARINSSTDTTTSAFHPYTLQFHLHSTAPTSPNCTPGLFCLIFLRTADNVPNDAPPHTGGSQFALPTPGIPHPYPRHRPA